MGFTSEPRRARKIQNLDQCQQEVLVFTTKSSLENWPAELCSKLSEKVSAGVNFRIFMEGFSFPFPPLLAKLKNLGAEVRLEKNGFLSWLRPRSAELDVWVFDRSLALVESSRRSKGSSDTDVEYLIGWDAARVIADYFQQRWESASNSFSYVVRQKKFLFHGGKGASKEFLSCLENAREEVCLFLPEVPLSPSLLRALLELLDRGVKLRVFTNNARGLGSSNKARMKKGLKLLTQAGAQLNLTNQPFPLPSSCALLDRKWIYTGPLPLRFARWRRQRSPALLVHDEKAGQEILAALEGQWIHGSVFPNTAPTEALALGQLEKL